MTSKHTDDKHFLRSGVPRFSVRFRYPFHWYLVHLSIKVKVEHKHWYGTRWNCVNVSDKFTAYATDTEMHWAVPLRWHVIGNIFIFLSIIQISIKNRGTIYIKRYIVRFGITGSDYILFFLANNWCIWSENIQKKLQVRNWNF